MSKVMNFAELEPLPTGGDDGSVVKLPKEGVTKKRIIRRKRRKSVNEKIDNVIDDRGSDLSSLEDDTS